MTSAEIIKMSCRLCITVFILVNICVSETYTLNPLIFKSVITTTMICETIEMNCDEYVKKHRQYTTSEFVWLKNGKLLHETENYNRLSLVNKNETLKITNITIKDEGNYSCGTSNQFQNDYTIYTFYTLTVNDLPKPERHSRTFQINILFIGESLELNCFEIYGNPDETDQYTWLKNGKILREEESNESQLLFGNRDETLTITNITQDDIYECRASNKFRIDFSVYQINVDKFQHKTSYNFGVSNITRNIGEFVSWNCVGRHNLFMSNLSRTWLKNDEPSKLFTNNTRFKWSDDNNYTLEISELTFGDAGHYRCVTSDGLITGYNNWKLTVLENPKKLLYRWYTSNITLMRDVSVQLRCNILNSTYKYDTWFSWTKNGNPLVLDDSFKETDLTLNNPNTLLFLNIISDENVTYECEAENNYYKMYSVYKINVVDSQGALIINSSNSEYSKTVGESVQFWCYVQGMPSPTITWHKNDRSLDVNIILHMNDSRMLFREYNQNLLINYTKMEDNGYYTCIVTNEYGYDIRTFKLNIIDSILQKDDGFFIPSFSYYLLFFIFLTILGVMYYRKKMTLKKETALPNVRFVNDNIERWNSDLDVKEQVELLPYDEKWEFSRNKLKLGKQIGSGAFGVVYKSEATGIIDQGRTTSVAVKMVKPNSDSCYTNCLLSEIKIMMYIGKHINVVNLLGASTGVMKNDLMMIVEYCRYGNIRDYLLKQRNCFVDQVTPDGLLDFSIKALSSNTLFDSQGYLIPDKLEPAGPFSYQGDYTNVNIQPMCTHDLICWSFQVARGMEYLSSKKILHGDLATRNILLAEDNIIKICDFGLARTMSDNDFYIKSSTGPLPIKWMAIESLRDRVFSTQSDVWSFGIALWEIFSLAVMPYSNIQCNNLLNELLKGYRMEQPKYANTQIYYVILDCWKLDPCNRPSFTELAGRMGDLLPEGTRLHYIDLNEVCVRQYQ